MKRTSFFGDTFVTTAAFALMALSARAQDYDRNQALAYQKAGDWSGALRYDLAWTQAEPNNADAWGCLGVTYGNGLNQQDQAADAFRHSLAIEPDSAECCHALGVTYIRLKKYGDAVATLKQAIQLNPNQPTYRNNLSVAYSEEGAFKAALTTLDGEMPIAEKLNDTYVWYVLGNGYAKLHDVNHAIPAYKRALQLDANYAAAWTNLGTMLEFGGNYQDALQAYNRGAALGDATGSQDAAQLKERVRQAAATQAHPITAGQIEHWNYMKHVERVRQGFED